MTHIIILDKYIYFIIFFINITYKPPQANMSVANSQATSHQSQSRITDSGSLANVLFPSQGSFRYLSNNSELGGDPLSATGEAAAPNLIIWGTDVNVEACKQQFIEFLKESRFSVDSAEMDEARLEWDQADGPRPLYLTKLEEILHVPNEPFLTVNCAHLKEYNYDLYKKLIHFPTEVVQIFDMGANELFQELYPDSNDNVVISVRPFNGDRTYTIRGLDPQDINSLITLSGMVTRCSTLIPEMIRALFRCSVCFFIKEVPVESGRIAEPHVCIACNSKFSFVLDHNRCRYVDRQLIKFQESPDDMPAGQTPATVALVACADLVDKVFPGERIFVTGIYRAIPTRLMSRQRKVRTVYRTTVDVLHFRRVSSGRFYDDNSKLRFSPERVDILKAMAKDDDIYERLANSLCPSIFGHLDVKKGVLLQLLGGTKKEQGGKASDPKIRHFRAEVNILLCGDPGTSKSQILQYVHRSVPRGVYTSGKGSSAVGLTAYITKDPDSKQMVLQTGALVMCDGGICCIDEFDKMSDSTRGVLHEVMEQQTLSIAKAGIVCQLNARTSILAAANPEASDWDRRRTVVENVKLPDTLLSRFDLIFLILDPNDAAYDKEIARHLISAYYQDEIDKPDGFIEHDMLKDYIAYARANINPILTMEAFKELQNCYLELRSAGSVKGRITAYPRNLESLIRLSEAHAKLRFSHQVEVVDVFEANRLTREALKLSQTDPNNGKIGTTVADQDGVMC